MLHRILILLLLLQVVSLSAFSQNSCHVGIGTDWGLPIGGTYSESKDVLKSNSGHIINASLLFNTILSERIGFEVAAGQNNQVIKFSDQKFKKTHNDKYEIKIKQKNLFPNLEASVFYLAHYSDNTNLYFKLGYRWNYPGNKIDSKEKYVILDGSDVQIESAYTQQTEGILGEVGIRGRNNNPFYFGIKYYYGMSPNVTTDYTVRQKTLTYKDQFVSNGSFIGIALGLNLQVFEWDYPNIKLRLKPKKKPNTSTSPLPKPEIAPEQRKEQIIRRMTLTNPVITIKVYDPNKIDNDIVSIKLNNEYVVSNLVVVKEPWIKEIILKKGENRLTFQAMNLGKYSPNTAEMIIQAGREVYKLQFNTTLELNQVLIITIP